MRQMVFSNDDFNVYAEISRMAKNFDNAPACLFMSSLASKLQNLHVHDHSVEIGNSCHSCWNLPDAMTFRNGRQR